MVAGHLDKEELYRRTIANLERTLRQRDRRVQQLQEQVRGREVHWNERFSRKEKELVSEGIVDKIW